MGNGLFRVKLFLHLADPSTIPHVMGVIEGVLREGNCSYTTFPSWLVGVCRDSLIKVRVPLEPPRLGMPPARSIIEVMLEAREPVSVFKLTSAFKKIFEELKGIGVGVTLEA
ncbi:MAG: hypothetical protein GSR85_02875 [Desulfurococcales archaeon]|nr:hypothetical protein [Desulfurococcales archaeon]